MYTAWHTCVRNDNAHVCASYMYVDIPEHVLIGTSMHACMFIYAYACMSVCHHHLPYIHIFGHYVSMFKPPYSMFKPPCSRHVRAMIANLDLVVYNQ
jgi:hypothetical protein